METKTVDIESLVLDPENARAHPEYNLATIQHSLERFGQVAPIIVDRTTRIVIGGNGVLQSLKAKGKKTVEIVEFDARDEFERKALALALNRTAETSRWDFQVLAEQLAELQAKGEDVLSFGWSKFEIDFLLAKTENVAPPPDEEPGKTDAEEEWEGMPEFEQEDKTAFRQIIVSFKSNEDVQKFAEVIGQKITEKVRSIWFPEAEIEKTAGKTYE